MKLRSAAWWALVSGLYFLALRAVGTLAPLLISGPLVVNLAVILSLFASLGFTVFFMAFFYHCQNHGPPELKEPALWAVAGSLVGLLSKVKFLLISFGFTPVSPLLDSTFFNAVGPVVASIFFLYFMKRYHQLAVKNGNSTMAMAIKVGMAGFGCVLLIQLAALACFWGIAGLPASAPHAESNLWLVLGFSLGSLGLLSFVFFLAVFQRSLSQMGGVV